VAGSTGFSRDIIHYICIRLHPRCGDRRDHSPVNLAIDVAGDPLLADHSTCPEAQDEEGAL